MALTDVNIEGVKQAAGQIAATAGAGKTIALAVNVTDGASVEEAVYQAVRRFGGFDLLVSNAGVCAPEASRRSRNASSTW